ncbi:Bacteriophage lambda, GpA [uncultured Caudovirales phage]|uniref:Bacteriophage lambda, GpA n=1 Tax=uncultured Caudovirales phage TaxID=2100421 RepID=A0A6J7X4L9_9CAUD|nr:Bacteriophage lambda, GpA [uncultured Caudovirales phage]CAB5224296.1 Bacteriophage lambda, GpA [uncultured Caudovirales phage]
MPLSAAGQKWSSEDARFVRRIMECFADEGINEITCMCSAQSAKTLTILVLMCWAIAEDPGPILWVTSSEKEGKKLSKSRLMPLLERCAPVAAKLPQNKSQKMTLEIYFPGAPLVIVGCEAEAGLQSTPYRYVFCDEARQYPKGALEMLSKRFRSYPHNYKKVIISTPDMEGDALHRTYLAGSQEKWFVKCPKCGDEHELLWGDKNSHGGVKWTKNKETYDDELNTYRFDDLDKTVRYCCWNEACDHEWRDVIADRKYLSTNGRWVAQNPNAPSNSVSFNWNAVLPWWASLTSQVREFLSAKAALEWADPAPLKDHMNETRGQVWTDQYVYTGGEKYIDERIADYNPEETWPEEVRRIMTIDVQGAGGRHFYFVIRAWSYRGWSRLIQHGVVWSWEEIALVAQQWGVEPNNVVIDTGAWAPECYKQVVASGYRYKAFKGDDKDTYRVKGKSYIYSVTSADPAIGTSLQGRVRTIDLVLWAKYGALLRLYAFMHGDLGKWEIHANASAEYKLQATSWDRRQRTNRDGSQTMEWYQKNARKDHYSDCEQMQVVAAAITGLLSEPGEMPLFE